MELNVDSLCAVGGVSHIPNTSWCAYANALADAIDPIEIDTVIVGIEQTIGQKHESAGVGGGDVFNASGRLLAQQEFISVVRVVVEVTVVVVVDEDDPACCEARCTHRRKAGLAGVVGHTAHHHGFDACNSLRARGPQAAGEGVGCIRHLPLVEKACNRRRSQTDQDRQNGDRYQQLDKGKAVLPMGSAGAGGL